MDEKVQVIPKVCILTAGKGSRLGDRTTYFNKALLRVGNKAVISHTIDQFPHETEFVIALGYKSSIVKQYLEIAHPDRKFTFVEVDKYSVPGSGPGYAMLKCQEYLQCPFYFFSCDSIVTGFPKWEYGWVGTAKIDYEKRGEYCTINDQCGCCVLGYADKDPDSPDSSNTAFVGVAFVKEWLKFWEKLQTEIPTANEEIQIAPTLLIVGDPAPVEVKWWDTGSEAGLKKAREDFPGIQNLDKLDEELYVLGNSVIKYFHNESMVKNRVIRAAHLGNTVPKIEASSKNFYKYNFVEGKDLFKIENQDTIMLDLLNYTQANLWTDVRLKNYDELIFNDVCRNFYFSKTIARLDKLYEKIGVQDKEELINDVMVPSLKFMFERINWKDICNGVPSNFHGDWIFANTVQTPAGGFKFLDWRQDFGGLIEYGDRYYDFAKMFACLLWPHNSIKNGSYGVGVHESYDGLPDKERNTHVWIETPGTLKKCANILTKWLFDNGYDIRKTKILTAIVWLNMSPLHEKPLDVHLYYWGKYHLYKALIGE